MTDVESLGSETPLPLPPVSPDETERDLSTKDAPKFDGARHRRSIGRIPLRILALGLVAASTGSMITVDRLVARTQKPEITVSDVLRGPLATDPNSQLSNWFCAGGLLANEGDDLVISMANPTSHVTKGTVTFYGSAGERATVQVDLPARSQTTTSARGALTAKNVGALVEFDRGGIGVDHRIERNGLSSISPCSSSASPSWYFADGNTEIGSSTELSLFNPFSEDAVVDLSFATDQGPSKPSALQGFVVAANAVATIDVGSYVRRRSLISTSLHARVGRLVAEQVQSTDQKPRRLAVVSGSASLGSSWYFPNGRTTQRLAERYVVFNPTDNDVSAQIDFVIDGAESEPFDLDVPKFSQVELVPADESRVPVDVGYSVVVATEKDSLVVSRTLTATSALRSGMATTVGGRRIAKKWLVPDTLASTKRDDRLVFLNPTDTDSAVTVSLISAGTSSVVSGLKRLLVVAGGRLSIRVGDFVAVGEGSALVIETEGAPIIVERTASLVSGIGDRPEQPQLLTVDSSRVLSSPDADSGVDEGDSVSVSAALSASGVALGAGGRLIGVGLGAAHFVVAATTTTTPSTTSTATPSTTSTATPSTTSTATPSTTTVSTTAVPKVPLVVIARPTKSLGSTSSAIAIPLDGF